MDNLLLSRYRLIRLLGAGARGSSFAAEDLGRARTVVVKALVPTAFPPDFSALLEASFPTVRLVAHPLLAPYVEMTRIEEPPPGHTGWPPTARDVLIREWAEGQSLLDALPNLDMTHRVEAALQTCRALGALHKAGVAHGALHPGNVIVAADPAGPRVALVDHGLEGRALPAGGERFSSYVAPERLGGQADLRADLFSLGQLLRLLFGLDRGVPTAPSNDVFFGAIQGLIEWCTTADPTLRPAGAWEAGEAVAKAAKRFYHPSPEESGRGVFLQGGWIPRERELAPLRARWREAIGTGESPRPRPGVVVIEGPAGCGKTSLLDRFASEVRESGAIVARGTCAPDGRDGFDAAVEALSALDANRLLTANPVPEEFAPYRPALVRMLGLSGPSAEELHGREAEREDLGIQEAFTQTVLLAARQRPVLLWIDEFERADEGTARLVGYLARTLASGADRPVLVLLSMRADAPAWLCEGALSACDAPMQVSGWTHEESAQWMEGFLGVRSLPEGAHDLVARAGGNALVMEESAKDLLESGALRLVETAWRTEGQAPGAAGVAEVLRRRIGRCTPEETSVLLDLATWGRPATVAEVLAICGGGTKTLAALLRLVARQLVRREERDGVLAFRVWSGETARTVREQAAANERLGSHRRVAKSLEGRGKAFLEARAWHSCEGKIGSEGLLLVLEAEDHSRRRHAWSRAVGLCDRALELLPRDDRTRRARVLKEMGDVQAEAGLPDRAVECYQRARDLAFDLMGMPERAELVRAGVRALTARGMAREALTQGVQALESLVLEGCAEERARLCEAVAATALLVGEADRCLETAQRGLAPTRGIAERTRARLECLASAGLRAREEIERSIEAVRRALAFAEAAGDARAEAHALGHLGACENDAGRLDSAKEVYERQLTHWKKLNDPEGIAAALANLGGVSLRQGRPREALQYVEGSLLARERIGRPAGIAQALLAVGRIHYLAGRHAEAREAWDRAERIRSEIGDKRGRLVVSTLLACLEERTGEWGDALARHRQGIDERGVMGDRAGVCGSTLGVASVLLAIGERRGAGEALEQALGLATDLHHAEHQARGGLLKAGMLRRAADRETAARLVMQAQAAEHDLRNLEGELDAALEAMELAIDAGDQPSALRTLAWCRVAAGGLGAGYHLLRAGVLEARMELARGTADPARLAGLLAELHERASAARALPLRAEVEERMAEALRAAGQPDAAARWIENAVTTWREVASRVPGDLQDAFWGDPRRRGLRQKAVAAEARAQAVPRREAGSAAPVRSEWTLAFLEERLAGHLARRAIDEALSALGAARGMMWMAVSGETVGRRVAEGEEGAPRRYEDWDAGDFPRAMACNAANGGAPWVSDDITLDALVKEQPESDRPASGSYAAVPLPGKDEPMGALYLDAPGNAVFSAAGRAALETFARAVALAWERLERERESRERAIVAALLKKTFARPEASEVVRKVVTLAKRLGGATRSALLVREGEGLRPLLVRPEGELEPQILEEVIGSGGAIVHGRESGTGSLMCVPLRTGEQCVGALYLENDSDTFGPRIAARLTAFADLLAGPLALALREAGRPSNVRAGAATKRKAAAALEAVLIAQARAMRDAVAMIERVADDGMTVLLVGEEGTGKETLARHAHGRGDRREKPFLVESCGMLSEQLLEAALFGQRKGAFPGADREKKGALERAHGGTVYLDGVDRVPPLTLDKLVQAFASRRIVPVGGGEAVPFEARLIVGSQKAMPELAERLGAVTVSVPPLRERREDIPLHVDRVLASVAQETRSAKKRLDKRGLEAFLCYEWPGNLRELESELRRMCLLAKRVIGAELVSPKILGAAVQAEGPQKGTFVAGVKEMEREAIRRALTEAGGSIRRASKILGMDRMTLTRRMRRYGIVIPESQADDEAGQAAK